MTDARYRLLDAMQDLMSNYLLDECPDNVTWEDFDPDIDGLRSSVADLIDKHCRGAVSTAVIATHLVEVEFFSGDDCFATAAYTIDASTPEGAEHHALSMSLDSIYNDPRIPDLSRAATARPMDDPDEPR
jgi:hypothetical protein